MLNVDENKLKIWIKEKFGEYKDYHGDILVNSPFKKDNKFKLSISPSLKCFHCWKTDKSGPIWKLVSLLDHCSKDESILKIYQKNSIQDFENKINELRNKSIQPNIVNNIKHNTIIPDYFKFISLESKGEINLKALKYIISRKIDPIKWKIGYCFDGKYNKRLILPVFNKNEEWIYWTARSLYNQEPKYINPSSEEFNIKKEDYIFSKNWEFNDNVFIVEGIINAISLIECGFNAISIFGKSISQKQLEYIKNSNIIIALDNDSPGREALIKNMKFLNQNGIFNISFVLSQNINEDWNDMLVKYNKKYLFNYINSNIKKLDINFETKIKLNMNI